MYSAARAWMGWKLSPSLADLKIAAVGQVIQRLLPWVTGSEKEAAEDQHPAA
jgi:hypothetical protein